MQFTFQAVRSGGRGNESLGSRLREWIEKREFHLMSQRSLRQELAWALGTALVLLAVAWLQGGELTLDRAAFLAVIFALVMPVAGRLYDHYRIRRLGGVPETRPEYRALVEIRKHPSEALPAIKYVAKRFATYSFHRNHINLELAAHQWLELKHAGRTLNLRVEESRRSVQVWVRSPSQRSLLEFQRALEKLNEP